jgi:hypothetical protein
MRRVPLGFATAAAATGLTLVSVDPANALVVTGGNGKVVPSCHGSVTTYRGKLTGGSELEPLDGRRLTKPQRSPPRLSLAGPPT